MYQLFHTEQHILTDLAAGKKQAAEWIYKHHFVTITRWIMKYGGSDHDAADVFQEAMIVLYEKAHKESFRLECKIGTYLFAISKHIWYKKRHTSARSPEFLTEDTESLSDDRGQAYEEDISVHEERENYYVQLDAALAQLGEPCSSLLKAYYHQDKSMSDIASQFGYTNPDNAKTQKYKCLGRLRKIFFGVQAK